MDNISMNCTFVHGLKREDELDPSVGLYRFLSYDLWEAGADPRVSEFPLMAGGPWVLISILSIYLLFVKSLGPRLMANRKPFDLRRPIFVYNVAMMIANGYFFASACEYTNFGLRTWGCINVDPNLVDETMKWKLYVSWLFFVSKFVDLMETIFFVLRKKEAQASFLHVFHHTIVPIDIWVGIKYSPSESACFFPLINSFVHVVMYFYYALSTMGPRMRPYLWWKPYLTQLQIGQLVLVAVHCLHLCLLPNCNIPKAVFAVYLPQVILLVYLFTTFFMRSYKKNLPVGPLAVHKAKMDLVMKELNETALNAAKEVALHQLSCNGHQKLAHRLSNIKEE